MMPLNSPDDNLVYFVEPAGSKSMINRLLILNSVNKEPITLCPGSDCQDVTEMLNCLELLGLKHKIERTAGNKTSSLSCMYAEHCKSEHPVEMEINEAGTVFRFLLTRLAVEEGCTFILKIGKNLQKRPYLPLINALRALGADIGYSAEDSAGKILIRGKSLNGGKVNLPANISSQFVSSLLLSAALFRSGLEISFTKENEDDRLILYSSSYIQMTIQLLNQYGVSCCFEGEKIVCSNQKPHFREEMLFTEPDYSTAPSFWALSLITRKRIAVYMPADKSVQGDFRFIHVLEQLGFKKEYHVKESRNYLEFSGQFSEGIEISMKDMPDQVMNLALLALFCTSPCIISDIEVLRYKESDRIENLITELTKLNADIRYENGKLMIKPGFRVQEEVLLSSHNDHRLAMIFLILQDICPLIKIDNTECICKSAPEFIAFLSI